MQWIKPNLNIDFLGKTRLALTISAIALALSVVGVLVWPGPNYGVDFSGGASLQIRVREDVTPAQVQQALAAQGYENPEVVTADDGSLLIRVRVDTPSESSRNALADAVRAALGAGAPGSVPVAAPESETAEPPAPGAAPAPMLAVVHTLLRAGALAAVKQAPPPQPDPVAEAQPQPTAEAQPQPTAEAQPQPAPEPLPEPVAEARPLADTPPAPAADLPPLADTPPVPAADLPLLADTPPVPAADLPPLAEAVPVPGLPPSVPPVFDEPVRVYEVVVDQSGAKLDILVNRSYGAEDLLGLLGPITFEGRSMGEMIGALHERSAVVDVTEEGEGRVRHEIPLSMTVNLNEQDVAAVQELVRGSLEAAGAAPAGSILSVEVTLAPIALTVVATVHLDLDRLVEALDATRYRDISLLVRCTSAICPVSIDERERVYGYEVRLRGFGPDVVESLEERLGEGAVTEVLSMEWVGPKVGEKLRNDGIKSVLIALGLILVYVALRFDLRFAPGAVACLLHDAMLTLGFFAFTGMEVNLATVAAVLTIVGYSVNDTIVVYDRIRENLQKMQEKDLTKVVNLSINETLSRTLLTSLTTMLAVLMIAVFARGTIQDFAVAMIVGILIGTYSSVYIAAPLSIWIDKRFFRRSK
jgi:preprotein translocase SecF subunit